jgi:hypothetical protein
MIMRVFTGVMACVGIGAVSIALADPADAPKSSAPAAVTEARTSVPASPSTAAAPATPAAPAVTITAATPDAQEQLERHFLSEGYKSEMHGSQKVFCRREDTIGTRLGASKNCGTVDQLKQQEDLAAQATHNIQRTNQRPGN